MPNKIYLDNAATTPVDKRVMKAMQPYFNEKYGNASSSHLLGEEAKRAIEESRQIIAKSLGAHADEIIFTSGGTESNNFALKGIIFATGKRHIITTKIEHDCVLNTCKWLEKELGIKVTYLDVDEFGFVNPADIEAAITPDTALVSIIHGNNEIGTLQPIEKIGEICRKHRVYFHIDACQSYTKTPINVKRQNLDLVTINAHKIHGPKGVGALYIRKGTKISPLLHGGGHEGGLRSGTQNVPGIVGFATAVKIANKKDIEKIEKLRDKLINRILNKIPNININGPWEENKDERLCNNINIRFNNIEGEAVGDYLNAHGIFGSTGSACSSQKLETSHVLKAIGLSDIQANSSIRLSLSKFNTEEEIDKVLEIIPKIVNKLRRISPLK